MKFQLLGREIEISEGRKNYMKTLAYYQSMAQNAATDFRSEYNEKMGLVFLNSTYADKFQKTYGSDDYMDKIVMRYVAKTRQYLTTYGIYDLSDAEIWNEAIITEDRSVSRLQYEFNGFILECLERQEDDSAFISRIKSRFEGNFFESCLHNDVMSLCDFTINYLDKHNLAEIQFVYKDDADKARTIFQNLTDSTLTDGQIAHIMSSIPTGLSDDDFVAEYNKRTPAKIPYEEKTRLAFSLIELDPRNISYYEFIFLNFPKAKHEIFAIAKLLCIDLTKLVERDIENTFNVKRISCEADALQMQSDLLVYLQKFEIHQHSVLSDIEKILEDYDIAARTYESIQYDTREQKAKAEADDKYLGSLYGDVHALTKEQCMSFITTIKVEDCTGNIKEKHVTVLRKRISSIQEAELKEMLTGLESKSESECAVLKAAVYEYDAPCDLKEPFIKQIVDRIYSIWDMEDFEKFSEIFKKTPVGDSAVVGQTCSLIQREGRTETKELFVKALYLLNENEVTAAAKYALAKESGMVASLLNMGKKESYMILTLNGRVMHPAIVEAMKVQKEAKGSGLLGGLGKLKNSFGFGKMATSRTDKFCPNCGQPVDQGAKFCSSCGNKVD